MDGRLLFERTPIDELHGPITRTFGLELNSLDGRCSKRRVTRCKGGFPLLSVARLIRSQHFPNITSSHTSLHFQDDWRVFSGQSQGQFHWTSQEIYPFSSIVEERTAQLVEALRA